MHNRKPKRLKPYYLIIMYIDPIKRFIFIFHFVGHYNMIRDSANTTNVSLTLLRTFIIQDISFCCNLPIFIQPSHVISSFCEVICALDVTGLLPFNNSKHLSYLMHSSLDLVNLF